MVSEKQNFFKATEKAVNFIFGQGNLKSAQSQGNLYNFGYFKVFLTFIEHPNKKNEIILCEAC